MSDSDGARASALLARFGERRILIVGDLMLDRFLWGDVSRISPEAPVPVVRVRTETEHLGGAANVAANVRALGGKARVAGLVGGDPGAERLAAALDRSGIERFVVSDPERATTMKTRVIARSQQVVRVDRESDALAGGAIATRLIDTVLDSIEGSDALVISDYDKGVIGRELLAAVLPRARELGKPVVVDPKISHFPFYQPVTVLTPNQAEAARATAMEIRSDADCLTSAHAILERLDTRAVLVTRGERGMLLVERGRDPRHIPAVAREVYDVTGAGDTVVAVLALCLAAGAELAEAAILANQAGGIVVGKVGTATVAAEELVRSFLTEPRPGLF